MTDMIHAHPDNSRKKSPLSLLRLQQEMTQAILDGDVSRISAELKSGKANSERRFEIFRNNSFVSLTACLKSVFPVSMTLCDERFFNYAAYEFIKAHPPREARLSVYGAEFPAFLARFEPSRDFPILVDMATLEWAVAVAVRAPELRALPMEEFSGIEGDGSRIGLVLQPSLRFLITRWPLLGVWADQKNGTFDVQGPLEKKSNRVVVCRQDEGVRFFELAPARFSFWRSLAAGRSLESAATGALLREPLFDLLAEIVFLSRQNLVTNIRTNLPLEIDDEQ
jgi:Putative DNA-binding domain